MKVLVRVLAPRNSIIIEGNIIEMKEFVERNQDTEKYQNISNIDIKRTQILKKKSQRIGKNKNKKRELEN
jgi:hypothetical protein